MSTSPLESTSSSPASEAQRRLRLWPAVAIVVVEWLLITVPSWLAPATLFQFFMLFLTPMAAALAIGLWWLFFSRLRWAERVLLLLACVCSGVMAFALCDSSMGALVLVIYMLPAITAAWALWLLVTPMLSWPIRRIGLLIVFVLVWGYFPLIRFDGTYGNFAATFNYRWTPTEEQKLLAELAAGRLKPEAKTKPADKELVLQTYDWSEFRGPERDGRRIGENLAVDWQKEPPRQLWRHRVGPGWSSFAVVGTHLFTQEQRGEEELVICYDADTGAERWVHRDKTRFAEAVGGPGPRATPTFHEGKLYTLGAKGRLNCLAAATGKLLWSRDIAADAGAKTPEWGFASSPLLLHDIVTVFAGGPSGKGVLGYRAATGELAWSAPAGQLSYCSPQRAVLDGVEQILIATNAGLTALEPRRGETLWKYDWLLEGGARIVQPAVLSDSDVLIGTGVAMGTRRLRVKRADNEWKVQEVWATRAISPYYNDLVVHKDCLYGFDGNLFTCVNLEDGKRKWRTRGYGNGQVLLLADQDLLLVLSEEGEVALLAANPREHKVMGSFQAINGKTWNHPVLAHGKLFVRNGEEAAAYHLAVEDTLAERQTSRR